MDGNVIAYDHVSNRNEKGWNMLNKLDKNLQGFWNLSVYELLYLLEQKNWYPAHFCVHLYQSLVKTCLFILLIICAEVSIYRKFWNVLNGNKNKRFPNEVQIIHGEKIDVDWLN